MSRVLTGIQSTGIPHLGNILGAILPAIEMSKRPENESYLFIADLHSLTQIKNSETLGQNTFYTASAWLACGLDTDKTIFYKQSDVPQTTELTWYLNCFYPYNRLQLAHSFKDKSNTLQDINAGLFSYPILMAADILLYDADIVPVGKDQIQHLEITRSVANRFNSQMGQTLVLPKAQVQKDVQEIPGRDGLKMSKSKNNVISIFEGTNKLRKQIMSIKTDSKGVDQPKNPETCTIFKLYSLLSSQSEKQKLKEHYLTGSIGYGEAKSLLLDKITNRFEKETKSFDHYLAHPEEVKAKLSEGAKRARKTADHVLKRVRNQLGY